MAIRVLDAEVWQLEEIDLVSRAASNAKISHAYFRLYYALIDTYPDLLTGEIITNFDPSAL